MTVNGRRVEAEVEPRTSLADFLREHPTQWFNFFDVWRPFGEPTGAAPDDP
jgi:predicted LPLAT superfamily acyltransferase